MYKSWVIHQRVEDMTREQAKQCDTGQEWRASGAELDAICRARVGMMVMAMALDDLRGAFKARGLKSVHGALGMIRERLTVLLSQMSVEQRRAIIRNSSEDIVTVSPMPSARSVNLRQEDVDVIAEAALEKCRFCALAGKAEKKCPLRRALDTVIGLKEKRPASRPSDPCPWRQLDEDILAEAVSIAEEEEA